MPHLKAEPAGTVESLDEFFALAHAIETDASSQIHWNRKAVASTGCRRTGCGLRPSGGSQSEVTSTGYYWAGHRGAAHPANSRLPWTIPDTFDAPPGEMAQSKLLTPYRALASAVRHEERAFAFWTYVSAHAYGQT